MAQLDVERIGVVMGTFVLAMLEKIDPRIAIPTLLASLVLWVLGYPALKARRDGVVQAEVARKRQAEADGEAAIVEQNRFRRDDSAADEYEARWKRALGEAETEREGRIKALALVEEARHDVHAANNTAQSAIAAAQLACKAEIERIGHSAEAKIFAASESAKLRVAELTDELNLQGQLIEALTEQNRQCEAANKRLSQEVAELRAWQQASDLEKGAEG